MLHYPQRQSCKPKPYRPNSQVFMPTGLGCARHDNCFTCPFNDCTSSIFSHGEVSSIANEYYYRVDDTFSEEPL